ncbi:MAGa4850 family ICE element protein [Mycoplasmopsis hyopharyngis]|uniref:MAGa4850 family ICE element protein n=1 Tax=Mycoplasmopsis hyopharyngis TaxID=29558 RepID=UPI003872BC0A
MGVLSQRYLDRQFSLNGFGNESYSRLEKQNENFDLKYSEKKNDKINFSFRRKLYKSKFYISDSYFQLLKTNKVFVEIFIAIVVLFNEAKKRKHKKNMFFGISKKTLEQKCGFKKTSIKNAIKKFLEIGIIDKDFWTNFKLIKPSRKYLKNDGEKFIKIESENAWKIFLLFGLKTLKTYQLLKWKSRMIFDKKFNSFSGRRKVILQNKKMMNVSSIK